MAPYGCRNQETYRTANSESTSTGNDQAASPLLCIRNCTGISAIFQIDTEPYERSPAGESEHYSERVAKIAIRLYYYISLDQL